MIDHTSRLLTTTVTTSLHYLDIDTSLSRMAAGLLPSLARRLGTLSWVISGIRTLPWTTSSACWKRFCSQRTSAISALDVSRRCAL